MVSIDRGWTLMNSLRSPYETSRSSSPNKSAAVSETAGAPEVRVDGNWVGSENAWELKKTGGKTGSMNSFPFGIRTQEWLKTTQLQTIDYFKSERSNQLAPLKKTNGGFWCDDLRCAMIKYGSKSHHQWTHIINDSCLLKESNHP